MGANVNNKSNEGTPIFVEACKKAKEHQTMCIMLLEHDSNPSLVDEVSLFVNFIIIYICMHDNKFLIFRKHNEVVYKMLRLVEVMKFVEPY